MQRMQRTSLRWFVAISLVALAVIAVDASQAQRGHTLTTALAPHLASTVPGMPIQAAVVLQKKDCTGNLRILDLVHRRRVRDNLRVRVIWYAGPHADSTFLRAALPAWTKSIPLVPLSAQTFESLSSLGHTSTPALVVLDQSARVRFVTQSPRSSR